MAAVRLLWVPLLLAPAGVVFVATRTAVDPIAGAERVDVVPELPARLALPTAAVGITTPGRHVTVKPHARRPVQHRAAKRSKSRIAHAPRPVYVVPKPIVAQVTPATTVTPHATQTPTPKPASKPTAKPTPALPPTPPTPEPTPPQAPPQPPQPPQPPREPTPTPPAPPPPVPTPPAPTPARSGEEDDQGEDNDSTRPGNGFGDRNHEHTGAPGQGSDHGRHGHD